MQALDDAAAHFSYICPIGYSNSSDCGYCRRSRSGQSSKRYSYYAVATSLTPDFYQALIDRCWRRSGTLLYRPNQKNSCCPHYTLRLDSTAFKATKDQRQAVNRFNKHVIGESYAREAARLHPPTREQVRKRNNEFDLAKRIHEPEAPMLKSPPLPAHQFTVALEPNTFTEEKYDVFENYQRIVHKEAPEKISRGGFQRFLCSSPLKHETVTGPDGKERQLGSFHQCYRLDGKLVAIGVLDLLPHCVSAVYFLYHESIHSFSPGKLGALQEIALALEGGYRWWYSGFYIHNCDKMKYKIDFSPQYVLDPETLKWDLLDKEALRLFDQKPYVSLSRERQGISEEPVKESASEIKAGRQDSASDADDLDDGEDESFLFHSGMPGIPSLDQMEEVDMDGLLLRSDYADSFFSASDLVVWEAERISQYGTLKSRIAEMVAAIGPDLMGAICVDFRKRSRS
ncbi:arginine-tRNA-protein transferase [Lasiosphaeria miniovina]|uniref:arginyltransferase n=1 Tax=Lasiosphaeria miniovina TaxID=1954250 RepID=A0AA39ZZD8_9PEZI|nr:arginine-tRNA-protein transferase [Lasiosphaeria miniovina]KAK0706422.1 arginine-tRNA-protein transferase [Lasiosphaeria miniovina]